MKKEIILLQRETRILVLFREEGSQAGSLGAERQRDFVRERGRTKYVAT